MPAHVRRKLAIENNLPSQMLALEPRYLFDAAAVTTVVDTATAPTADTATDSTSTKAPTQNDTAAPPAIAAAMNVPNISDQGFFIDENSAVNGFAGQIVPAPSGVTFTLIDGMDSAYFSVSETGEITVKDNTRLDYEDSSLPTFPIGGTGGGDGAGLLTVDNISDSTVVDFSTQATVTSISGPIQIGGLIGEDITVTEDPSSLLWTNTSWGLGNNGSWGSDKTFIGAAFQQASLLFSFNDGPVSAVGAFINYAPGQGSDLFITALDSGMNVLETYNITQLADIVTPDGFNEGGFRGIDRGVDDISFFEVSGYVPVVDDLTFTRTNAAAPAFDVPYLQFQVEATADNGDSAPTTTTIDIFMLLNDVNDAPVVNTPVDATINLGETATVQIIARDMDIFGDSGNDLQAWTDITYTLDPLPGNGPNDPNIDVNGLFTWTPTDAGTTTFTVKVSNNGDLEQTVQFDVTVIPAISISDAPTVEEGNALHYLVSLNGDSNVAVTADLGFGVGTTATGGTDYEQTFYSDAALTVPITSVTLGGSNPISVDVYVRTFDNDPPFNEADENVEVELTSIANATVGDTAADGTITDASLPAVTITGTNASGTTVEEGAAAKFTVSLSGASEQPATVDLSALDGTADSTDYDGTQFYLDAARTMLVPGNVLTFAAGVTDIDVYVDTIDNDPPYSEADETFTLTATTATGATGTDSVTGTITDSTLQPVSLINDSTNLGAKPLSSEPKDPSGEEEGGNQSDAEASVAVAPDTSGDTAPVDLGDEITPEEAAEIEALVNEADFTETAEVPGAGKPDSQQPQTRAEDIAETISIMDRAIAVVFNCKQLPR